MKVWTVVNQKGGVGKTTSAISIAGCLSAMGFKTLLVDLDPHASLTHYLGVDSECQALNLYDVFMASNSDKAFTTVLAQATLQSSIKNVDLLPAHMALATLDKTLGEQEGKGLIMQKVAQKFASKYDVMIMDCPPVLGVLMVNALVAAHKIILPTQTEHLALQGLDKMIHTLELMKNSLTAKASYLVVPTLFDKRVKACIGAFSQMREKYKGNIWKGYVPVDTKFRDASAAGLPINQIAPNTRGSFAYEKLVNELLKNA
ncbi:ParA family protein [Glaciecola sp. 2405UD65-10]|uniref:ParA family protein n=1 Tax=Glaciecola sp. 2405UD65-10 TaxID=3397244 RepID=UPI003B59D8F5